MTGLVKIIYKTNYSANTYWSEMILSLYIDLAFVASMTSIVAATSWAGSDLSLKVSSDFST